MFRKNKSQPKFVAAMVSQAEASKELRQYLNSQNLYTSIRMTAAAVIPAVILYHYNLLLSAIALPLGAIFTAFTDSPGPLHHRRNSLFISIVLNFLVILVASAVHAYPILVVSAILVFGVFFTMLSVYGSRASSIGLNALLVYIVNIDGHLSANSTALWEASLFVAGGLWYTILALLSYSIRPYKLIQQMLGECIIETADYLQTKAGFYASNPDFNAISNRLLQHQVAIRQMQDDLRETLFKTRRMVKESTVKGRVLMSVFLDSIDLMERIMTSQYNYIQLHETWKESDILLHFHKQLNTLSAELKEIGLALQSGTPPSAKLDLDALQQTSMDAFSKLRSKTLNENTIEDLIALRQILYSLQDITERIKRLRLSAGYDQNISREYRNDVDLKKFINRSEIDPRILLTSLTLQSASFRHAVRLTAAMLFGYLISFFFPLGHSYWILLTIAVIIKPAYSITRKRNIQRVSGTITGAAIGFGVLYLTPDKTVLFLVMITAMIVAFSFLRVNYFIGVLGITIYVLFSFYFLSAAGFQHALNDRLTDTLIGSVIAWLASILILPNWEYKQIDEYISIAVKANRDYFNSVAQSFTGQPVDATTFKLKRKDAFVALANLSDVFQRMLSEPKNQQLKMQEYHQFVATSHTLTSYIASLSYYAQRDAGKYASEEFSPLVSQIDQQFAIAADVLQHQPTVHASDIQPTLPISKRVQQLLAERRQEINAGKSEMETPVRRTLSDLKTINNQFELISTATVDEIRILEKIMDAN